MENYFICCGGMIWALSKMRNDVTFGGQAAQVPREAISGQDDDQSM